MCPLFLWEVVVGLTWNKAQREIYDLLQQGMSASQIKTEKGHTIDLIKKVQKAIKRGDAPGTPQGKGKGTPAGTPIFKATTKALTEALEPIIIIRWDSVRYALGEDEDSYPLRKFIDEATDLAATLVGAVPPGFERTADEETKIPVGVAVPVKEEEYGGDEQAEDSPGPGESEEPRRDAEGSQGAPGDAK